MHKCTDRNNAYIHANNVYIDANNVCIKVFMHILFTFMHTLYVFMQILFTYIHTWSTWINEYMQTYNYCMHKCKKCIHIGSLPLGLHYLALFSSTSIQNIVRRVTLAKRDITLACSKSQLQVWTLLLRHLFEWVCFYDRSK